MATERKKWLDSIEQAKWAKAHTFDAKIHRLFSNLATNSRLELVLDDKKMKAQGIEDMGTLLLKISKAPNTAAYIATGFQPIDPTGADKLIAICDPYHEKRKNLKLQIEFERQELKRAQTKPLYHPSFLDIEGQQKAIKAINSRLGHLQREYDALPDRNDARLGPLFPVRRVEKGGKIGFHIVDKFRGQAIQLPLPDANGILGGLVAWWAVLRVNAVYESFAGHLYQASLGFLLGDPRPVGDHPGLLWKQSQVQGQFGLLRGKKATKDAQLNATLG